MTEEMQSSVEFSRSIGKGHILLLGMFHGNEKEPKVGQEYRDTKRCNSLTDLNFLVKTLDDKHENNQIGSHCRTNFTNFRRMRQVMNSTWGDNFAKFDYIILDYFFCPVSLVCVCVCFFFFLLANSFAPPF